MTLLDLKDKVLSMIEEININKETNLPDIDKITKDPDIQNKLNHIINQVQFELSRIKKIPDYIELDVTKNQLIRFKDIEKVANCEIYQLDIVRGVDYEYKAQGTILKCLEDGKLEIEYFKYPKRIDRNTEDDYEFDLSDDVMEIMPYGVAGDLLKSDIANSYGNVYSTRYEQMLSNLDIRYNTGHIEFDESGGLEW